LNEQNASCENKKNGPSGLTRGFISFIGVAEMAAAIGAVLPMAAGVTARLSAWATVGLSIIMLLAIGYRARRRLFFCARSVCRARWWFFSDFHRQGRR
jgi:hypothetical protein